MSSTYRTYFLKIYFYQHLLHRFRCTIKGNKCLVDKFWWFKTFIKIRVGPRITKAHWLNPFFQSLPSNFICADGFGFYIAGLNIFSVIFYCLIRQNHWCIEKLLPHLIVSQWIYSPTCGWIIILYSSCECGGTNWFLNCCCLPLMHFSPVNMFLVWIICWLSPHERLCRFLRFIFLSCP